MEESSTRTVSMDDWTVSMEVMLASLSHEQVVACSILSVKDELRNPNEAAFKPKEVSLGPLHRKTTRRVQIMEQTKWHYLQEFISRNRNQNQNQKVIKDCGKEMIKLNKIIIASYGGNIESEPPEELAKLMIVDGCFLLELLMKLEHYMVNGGANYSNDPVLKNEKKIVSILSDITMLENQIPFIVLKKLYRKVFHIPKLHIQDDHRVSDIVQRAFHFRCPHVNNSRCAHILNLIHLSTVQPNYEEGRPPVKQELFRCATRLRAAGVIIEAKAPQNSTSCHKFVDWFNFDISFDDGKLKIPPLTIKETTEVKWRNLIAWEQSMIGVRCKYTSYGLFFQVLVCCKHDIELLEEKKIIINEAKKSKEELLNLFRTICKGAEYMDSSYEDTYTRLKEFFKGRTLGTIRGLPVVSWHNCMHVSEIIAYYWRNWYKILKRDYIPDLWKFIGLLAAATILALTATQTYYSIKK